MIRWNGRGAQADDCEIQLSRELRRRAAAIKPAKESKPKKAERQASPKNAQRGNGAVSARGQHN
eukprot:318133-Prorocentrum_minimum.AAC.1